MLKTTLLQHLFCFFLFLFSVVGLTQELPPVINFDPNEYAAGNQNWMVSQSDDGHSYVANGMGLLEYTGSRWSLYPVPNHTVVRSVQVVNDLIFIGAYMELGFFSKNSSGRLDYTSLGQKIPEMQDGEQFWHIEHLGDIIIFQSFQGIYLYNKETGEMSAVEISPSSFISNLFRVGNEIYFQSAGEGLLTINNGEAKQVIGQSLLLDAEIMHIFRKGEELRLITQEGNLLSWDGNDLRENPGSVRDQIEAISIFSALDLPDGSLVLGTVEDGIYHITDSEILNHFSQENMLLNNTVLSLFADVDGNIWAGLDNGLSIINLESPFRLFQDNNGRIGSVYTSFQTEEFFYLGTNQGLYYRRNGEKDFRIIEGTNGQVWSLQEIDGFLFCGHNRGTYLVEGSTARRIADRSGTWAVVNYEPTEGLYLQGHYNGVSLLRRQGDSFEALPLLEKFPHSSKFIISEADGDIWVGNEHKGVYKFQLDSADLSIRQQKNYSFDIVSGITSSIFKFNDTLYYATKDKIFQYRQEQDDFTNSNQLAELLQDVERISGKFEEEGSSRIWGFSKDAVFDVEPGKLRRGYEYSATFLPEDLRRITLGYENIQRMEDGTYLLGVTNGYLRFREREKPIEMKEMQINRVTNAAIDESPMLVDLSGKPVFDFKSNNISFNFSIPEYRKFLTPLYSYRLLGLSSQWSEWQVEPVTGFENLSYGNYEFQVRGKIANEITPVETFSFEIARPWYLSYTAFAAYSLLFLLVLLLIHQLYKRRHQKLIEENEKELRMKNLEAEQKIIKLQNEQLEKDMATKNKELAVSTMSLIKKNEFLTSIKEKLKTSPGNDEVKSVIKTIDKDINEEDNWNLFKEAFSNADKDFFKKIKALHPNLTSNDLKLCAYLRLNLSTKEIAPLLNISVKSVEIKRYRLRKKMDLPHEKNLTDYILEI